MIVGPGAESDVLPGTPDPNPILDQGCPRSVGGIESAKNLCNHLNILFKLEPLDCTPFLHGYGEKCSDAKVTIGIWRLPIVDQDGVSTSIPFYIVPGHGILLLGNEVCSQSNILGPRDLIEVPSGVLSDDCHYFFTYSEVAGPKVTKGKRTYVSVVPSKVGVFRSLLSFHSFTTSPSSLKERLKSKVAARKFAAKLHTYSHLRAEDMQTLCKRASVHSKILDDALKQAVERCRSCKGTGRPLQNRSVSIRKVLSTFNSHVQLDLFYLTEMGNAPVLHLVDVHTGFSATALVPTRDIDIAARTIEKIWVNIHGAPAKLSGDPEFMNKKFARLMERFSVTVEPRPARRHQKIGVVERKNAVVRTLVQRILHDVDFVNKALLGIDPADQDKNELHSHILSRATYLSNVLYGSRTLSSFEMVRGYTPSISGLPQSRITEIMTCAHQEQTARRALLSVYSARSPRTLKQDQLERGTAVYFFRRVPKPLWIQAWVRSTEEHVVLLSTRKNHTGKPVRAAYEDIRLMPTNPLLQELDEGESLIPSSTEIFDPPVEEPNLTAAVNWNLDADDE